jgi:hypothetical protein
MSFVKSIAQAISPPVQPLPENAGTMIVQGWRRSLKTSVIKL